MTPSTNPTSTTGSNGMNVIKCRNAMIVSPHPAAKNVTIHGVNLINAALEELGAPENLIQVIEAPSMDCNKGTDAESRCYRSYWWTCNG